MAIQSGPGTKGTRHIATRYPVTKGLTAGTTKQTGRQTNLTPQGNLGQKSTVEKRNEELL